MYDESGTKPCGANDRNEGTRRGCSERGRGERGGGGRRHDERMMIVVAQSYYHAIVDAASL
jgi:hypothetical protein